MKRSVFYISDGTGITAENLGMSLLTQFDNIKFEQITLPYINTTDKALNALAKVNEAAELKENQVIVFSTLVNPEIRQIIESANALILDFFKAFINPLEKVFGKQSSHIMGRTHGMFDYHNYMLRINAVNFALNNDDGMSTHDYDKADIILVGVSRCGKTPTSLYLAMQYGFYAANYPITEEDLDQAQLPKILRTHKSKLFGLTIDPKRLQQIRTERRPNSRYAQLKQCQTEVRLVETLYKKSSISYINTTTRSVEEIAAEIKNKAGLKRKI